MDILLNSLQYTIPSVVVMLTAYLLIKQYFDKEIRQQKHELLMNNQKLITPIRLQAYERLTLLLERISPENLLTRVYVQGMTAKEFKLNLSKHIRSEFDHNLSQQIYISTESWELIKLAKENLVKLLNIASRNINPSASANDLSKVILEMYLKVDTPPLKAAINMLKDEFTENFN